ncbi:hypothetical protein PF007_g9117 [Phytophthora fragariae]|uniref:Uncharacterized protein n=1 Tax=Phytophthora fragariae TaxID=53985 RepID=A0A6A3IPQ9_9STRA|nr:hypothetical protein PF003_g32385 [Phytophthora fragariae]KAE8982525.1 hypothetical protein PF011_g21581 [Phytophthora fragariae]KAE9117906.1 hypothetical protein PF007_g9117 [Phytophthora fragariae]
MGSKRPGGGVYIRQLPLKGVDPEASLEVLVVMF